MNKHLETQPLISIGMPIYNAGEYLKQAIDSIKKQTYLNWEFIIIDDGSTDGAISQLRAQGELDDKRIRIYSDGKNRGLAARLNECIDLAKGAFFARMDQDDISLPTRLEKQINHLLKNPNIDLVSCKAMKINMAGDEVGLLPFKETHAEIISKPWMSFYMPHPTWMGKVEWFKKFKYKTNPAPYFCEDQELLLRSHALSKFAAIEEVLFQYRMRNEINLAKTLKTYFAIFSYQLKFFISFNILYIIPAIFVLTARVIKATITKCNELFK